MLIRLFSTLIFIFITTHTCSATQADFTLSKLTLKEKIAQLCVVALEVESTEAQIKENETLIKNHTLGGLLFIGRGSALSEHKQIIRYQAISKYPLLITQDAESGLAFHLDDIMTFPRNLALGAIQDLTLIKAFGREIARQCSILGVHMNFAPVVDVNTNPNNPVINDRSFGDQPQNVSQKALAMMQGMQEGGVMACAKHFPGHGDTELDSHKALPVIKHNIARLNAVELYPFRQLIDGGVDAIMTAHLYVPAYVGGKQEPATLSEAVVTQLLQKQLGFQGLVVTDALNMKGVCQDYEPGEVDLKALLAGNDILLFSQNPLKAIELIANAVAKGQLSEQEIDRHVLKILEAKEQFALGEKVKAKPFSLEMINNSEAKNLKQKLYDAAITQLGEKELPEISESSLYLIGGDQTAPIAQLLKKAGIKNIYTSPSQIQDHDTVIIALMDMSRSASKHYGLNEERLELLQNLPKSATVLVFANPYSLQYLPNFKSVLVAYDDDECSQIAVYKILESKLPARGKLPVVLNL